MKNLSFVFLFLFLSLGLFAQNSSKAEAVKTEASNALIIGLWDLKTVNGGTVMNDEPVSGFVNFKADNTFDGVMMGDEGEGTYAIINRDNGMVLQTTEEENGTNEVVIGSLTADKIVLIVDNSELVLFKRK
jgi:hypothetical protein